jgi:hypothetical protein
VVGGGGGYSEHILNTGHTYGIMENTMDIIETNKKGQYLNTLENYHIYIYIENQKKYTHEQYKQGYT